MRTVFDQTNGLPTDEANAVLQTRDGYLWVGSYGGFLRFDGSEFHNFSTEGAIATPSIRCLFEDSAGRLWIGSSDAGVFVYENGVFTAVPCTKKNSYLSIRDFAEGRDGTIYVASTSGVCRVRSGLLVPYSNPYITGETAYALGIDRYGRLWCAMSTGKCAVMQDERVLAMLDAELFFEDGSVISCLTSDRANNIYLGTDGSTLAKVVCSGQRLDGTAFTVQTYEVTDAANHNRVGVTAEGDILVSGQQGFAWVTADGTQRDPHTGTSTDAVNCAALDTEGNVWLASSNEGLIRYSPGCFASPNLAAGLTDLDINAVTAAGGRYYAAVNQGLLAFDSDWHPVQNALTRALDGVPVQSLMVDSRGRLWCGTCSELGLVRYDTGSGEIVFFNQSNGLGSTRIRVAFELRDGMVAVGTQDGLALLRGDKVVAFYDKDSGLETQSILCIAQAPDGTLLAGSAGSGIYALAQDGSITKFSYEQGLEVGVVLRILQEEDGRSAFVSAGSHLHYWADGTFRRLDGLRIGPGSIFDLYERDGKLWLLQDSGIYALDKARILAGETPHATQYGTARGLTGSLRVNTCNYMAPDGSLYLATRNGVSVFDFREISAPMPPLVINSIRVDDRTYESPERLTLGSDARRMTIRFSALTYSGATDLCIGYQLVGFAKAKAYTVGSWLEVWLENYAKVKLRPSTFKTSQGFLKNHIKPQIGGIPLADLTSLDLQWFYRHLLDSGRVDRIEAKKKPKGLAPKTVRNIHQMIGSAYNLAMPRIARRILACFSFRSAAAAEPVQQSLQKNLNPHRGSGQADIDEGQIESGNKNGGYFFAQRVQSFCREPAMKWVTGAARARFLAAFARSKAVPPEAGAFMTSVTHSQPWRCKTVWM